MSWILLTIGMLVIAIVLTDLVTTVLVPTTGAGRLTRTVGRWVWSTSRRVGARPGSTLGRTTGPVALLATVSAWLIGLVVGFTIVLAGLGPAHLRTTLDGLEWDATTAPYVAITTLFTLGPGDVVPETTLGRTVVAAAAVTGLLLVTLAVTYLLPVVTSVTDRRIHAGQLSAFGTGVDAVRERLADGLSPTSVDQLLFDLAEDVRRTAQRHLTYPVLHYFHADERAKAFAPALATFTEAISHDPADGSWSPTARRVFLSAVDEVLAVTETHVVTPSGPDRATVLDDQPDDGPTADRRRRLMSFVVDSGWSWADDVIGC